MIIYLDDYQEKAVATMKKGVSKEEMDKYCCMKLAEEIGELSGMVAKHYVHGKPFDHENLKEEISDQMWYLANLAYNNGLKLSEIATFNIEKLKKRHGENYNPNFYKQ